MSRRALGLLSLVLVPSVGTGIMAVTAIMNSAVAHAEAPAGAGGATTTIGLVMGPSGVPLPNYDTQDYVESANRFYIHPNFPDTTYPSPYENGLFTPEYPVLSVPFSLNFPDATTGPLTGFPALSTSMGQGMLILENAIASDKAAGDASTVFGWSQSSTISGLVMQQLDPAGTPIPGDDLQFALAGDPSAPNGGLLERFDGLSLPSLGLLFDGATPANDFPTDIYTLEYDGFADFPKYPINVLADINALLGTIYIHGLYLTPSIMTPALTKAFLLPGSEALGADTLTNYYMTPLSALPAPDNYLPLLRPLIAMPLIGKPLADLLQPDLTVLVNLGYGSDNLGYSTPANVPTEFGLFPNVQPATVVNELLTAARQGISAFDSDFAHLSLASLAPAVPPSLPLSPADLLTELATAVTHPVAVLDHMANTIAELAAALADGPLTASDIGNAIAFSLPVYDLTLFLDNLADPINAIGLPIAADTGLLTLSAGFELQILVEGIAAVANDISAA